MKLRYLLFLLPFIVAAQTQRTVDSIADLLAAPPASFFATPALDDTPNATVHVNRYSTNVAKGIGERDYMWVPSYSGTTNVYGVGGGAFAMTGGAWVAQGTLNIGDFGARPNDATYDNSVHINAAIDWGNSTTPPTGWPFALSPEISLPLGDWYTRPGQILLKEGFTYVGEGEQGSRLIPSWELEQAVTVSSLTQTGGTATLVTVETNDWSSGDFILISGADQTEYNEVHHITVIDEYTATFPVDSGTVSPATGTIVITRNPFGIMNWRESVTDEFASTTEQQSNFGIRNLTIEINPDEDTPEGVVAMRIANAVEFKIKDVRFRMHNSPNSNANKATALQIELVNDLDIDNMGVDQGITAIKGTTRFGASYAAARSRVRNSFFFSQVDTSMDMETWLTSNFIGMMIANSGGDQSSEPNIQVYLSEDSYENHFGDAYLERFANYGWVVAGRSNVIASPHIYWSTRSSNVNYDKIGFDIYGDANTIDNAYVNGAVVGIRFNEGSSENVVRGFRALNSDTPYQGLTTDNVLVPDRNLGPAAVWNFPGLTSNADGTWISSTLRDTIDSGEEFSIMVTAASYVIPASASASQSQGLVAIGNTETPAAGNGSFRMGVDLTGRLFATFYGATSSDRRTWQTPTNSFPLGHRTTIYMARDSAGDVTFRINGQLIAHLVVSTNGTPPGATDAITGDYLSVGRIASSTTWTGWISDVGVFNKPLSFSEQVEFENGTLPFTPKLRAGQDETAINGGFESGITGWAAVAGGAIAQTNIAHTGTYSLHVAAAASGDGVATTGQADDTSGLVQYYVTGYVRWVAGSADWQIGRADSSDLQDITVATDGNWQAFAATIGGKVGQPSNVLRFLSANGSGTVDLDAITVRRYGALGAFSATSPIENGKLLAWDGETEGTVINDGIETYGGPGKGTPKTRVLTISGNTVTVDTFLGQRLYNDFSDTTSTNAVTVDLSAATDGMTGTLLLEVDTSGTTTVTVTSAIVPDATAITIDGTTYGYLMVTWAVINDGSSTILLANASAYDTP